MARTAHALWSFSKAVIPGMLSVCDVEGLLAHAAYWSTWSRPW